jgi:integrase
MERIESLADIVAPEALSEALTFLWRRSGEKMTDNINGMATVMLAIARHHARFDATAIAEIRVLVDQSKVRQDGLTEKNMARLRQFLDERNVSLLLGLPERLAAEAQQRHPTDQKAAVLMQTAVAVELLLMTMMRRKNLVNLSEDVHVKWSQSGRRGICHIAVDAAEVKNKTPLLFELPTRSAKLLRVYMQQYQSLLGTKPTRWLFPGRNGTAPKNAAGVTTQIAGTVFDRTGIKLHVHLFRHVGALLYLKRNPGGYEVLRRVFGHRHALVVRL